MKNRHDEKPFYTKLIGASTTIFIMTFIAAPKERIAILGFDWYVSTWLLLISTLIFLYGSTLGIIAAHAARKSAKSRRSKTGSVE